MPSTAQLRIFLLAALLISPAAIAGIHVDHHEEARFDEFATYQWIDGTPARRPEVEQAIRQAVERELAARGLEPVDRDPDLLVATHASPEGTAGLDPEAFVYGGAPWSGWTDHGPLKGALLVDLVDARQEILVWRGLSTSSVPSSTKKAEKKVVGLIRKMLRHYPPKP
jgi:hypothetical protein